MGSSSRVGSGLASPRPSFKDRDSEELSPKRSIELLDRFKRESERPYDEHYSSITEPVLEQKPSEHVIADVREDVSNDPPRIEYKYVGELFDCYVVIEYEGAALIIDKHAAHERVIFEDLKRIRAEDKNVASQYLMVEKDVELSAEELQCAEEIRQDLTAVGFEFNTGGGKVALNAIPSNISTYDAETLFVNILNDYMSDKTDPRITDGIRRERALYQIACKAAIKGGRHYDRSVIDWLVNKLLQLPDLTVCPHGRPVAYKLTKSELDRQFDRLK